jgi:hypothetical protein
MEDCNISSDLRQLTHGEVKALEYSRYDINGYHFRMEKLEASHPLVATCNSGVVTSGEDASRVTVDYYGVLQKIIEYTFGGTKERKVVFFNVIGLIQSMAPKWMISVWLRSCMNHAIQAPIFYLHIKCNRCTI